MYLPHIVTAVALAASVLLDQSAAAQKPSAGPISVVDGVVMKDGQPYRAVGFNYFEAWERVLLAPDTTEYRRGFEELGRRGVPFVRFMAGGYWPVEWKLYLDDKEEYFRKLDDLVQTAEKNNIGLIPSLFWYDACIPDLVGEPRNRLGDSDSKSIAFVRQYTREVVSRYVDSPAIWAWELGNEYNLVVDLPNAADHRPACWPQLGTPAQRSEADDLTTDMMLTVLTEFAKTVRAIDPHRPIVTGHATPRSAAQHLRVEHAFTLDSRDEFLRNLIDVTPDPVNVASLHLYPPDSLEPRFNNEHVPYEDLLSLAQRRCREAGKVLFVGEFGACSVEPHAGPEGPREEFLKILAAVEKAGVPLAAAWNYAPEQRGDDAWCVSPGNERNWMLDAVIEANRRMQAAVTAAR